ncbi:MAG TPA: HD domain-containing protein [Candidatus Paceibacterota bacterium]
MKSSLTNILKLTYSFSEINRDMYYPDRERPENDAEHAFQLSTLAWHIIEKDKLDLDVARVLKLCLAHDLVEIYAGDVPLWAKDGHDEKEAREKLALNRLTEELSSTSDMTDAIREYKKRETKEAIFVYGLDKLLPFLNQLHIGGKVWKSNNVSMARALEVLERQSKISNHLSKYFVEAIDYMKRHESELF